MTNMSTPPVILDSALPPLFARWISAILPSGIPEESRATCRSCAMLEPEEGVIPFHPQTKCCTYVPELVNFHVGHILSRKDMRWAQELIDMRLASRRAITPLGLYRLPTEDLIYEQVLRRETETFGRLPSARCPYYLSNGGLCGIWQARDAICSTWFCRYNRGPVGRRFWRALQGLLRAVERGLSLWALSQLGLPEEAIATLFAAEQQRRFLSVPLPPSCFGPFAGRERDLFKKTFELVEPLDWNAVRAHCGSEVSLLAQVVSHLHARLLNEELPKRIKPGPTALHPLRSGRLRAQPADASHDGIELPPEILAHLPRLASGELLEAMTELRQAGVQVDSALVLRLLDYEVLSPA
jgi:hypothetical protein